MENVNRIGATSTQLVSSNRESMNTFNSFCSWWWRGVESIALNVARRQLFVWKSLPDESQDVFGTSGSTSRRLSRNIHTMACLVGSPIQFHISLIFSAVYFLIVASSDRRKVSLSLSAIRSKHMANFQRLRSCARALIFQTSRKDQQQSGSFAKESEREMAFMLAILKQQKIAQEINSKQQRWYSIF